MKKEEQNLKRFEANDATESNEGSEMTGSFVTDETIDVSDGINVDEADEADEAPKKRRRKRYYGMLSQLETYRLVLVNVQSQPVIAQRMADLGYTAEVIDKGRVCYEESRLTYEKCLAERLEKLKVHQEYINLWNKLKEDFNIHREKARMVFRGNEAVYMALSLKGSLPSGYLSLIARMKDFYTRIKENEKLKEELVSLSLTAEDVSSSLNTINQVEELRSTYMRKKAESQDATEKRNEAFRKSDQWTRDFFTIARFAVRKSPQLQEAFGKIIRT